MIFKYAEYKKFIAHMKKFGRVTPLGTWDGSNAIILRHDVDFDIDAAYQLALIEAECGVRSTFFFLITCDTYNLFSTRNRKKVSEIAGLGFEIGLHFDPTIYANSDDVGLEKFVHQETGMLSFIAGAAVTSISLHNPSIHGQYPMFKGYNNAYDSRIFSDDKYLSDSRMDFRGKEPFAFVEKAKDYPIQILLHPVHYSEHGSSYADIFYQHVKNYVNMIDTSFQVNSTYAAQMQKNDLFSFIARKAINE